VNQRSIVIGVGRAIVVSCYTTLAVFIFVVVPIHFIMKFW